MHFAFESTFDLYSSDVVVAAAVRQGNSDLFAKLLSTRLRIAN